MSADVIGVDWSRGGGVISTPFQTNLNRIGNVTGCDGAQVVPGGPAALGALEGYDDWANIQYNLRASLDWSDGIRSTEGAEVKELTHVEATNLSLAADLENNGMCGSASCKMDIKPLDATNTINLAKEPVVLIILLGSAAFDVQTVDTLSLTLNHVPVVKVNGRAACLRIDTNRDGFPDQICTFPTTGLPLGVSFALLEGHLSGMDGSVGTNIAVQDRVRVIRRQDD